MTGPGVAPEQIHATCVALGRAGLLIVGPSGAGKSQLALQLMALGCALVSDDQTLVEVRDGALVARAPAAIRGKIEARGIGILAVEPQAEAVLRAVVDLGESETRRLPEPHETLLLGCRLRALHKVESGGFPAALMQYLKGGDCS